MLPYLRATDDRLLPLITYNQILLAIAVMVALKIIAKNLFKEATIEEVQNKKQRKSLENEYYYHLGMVLVLVATASWNAYDFYLWLGSYVAVGIFRNAVSRLISSQDTLLETLGFDNKIKQMLRFSRCAGFILLLLSLVYFWGAIILFSHSNVPLLTVLLYPTMRLAADSYLLFSRSSHILRQLQYFYNNNIDRQPLIREYTFFHGLLSAFLKVCHFGKLLTMIPTPTEDLYILVHGPWIGLLAWEFLQGLKQLATLSIGYYEYRWLIRTTDAKLKKEEKPQQDICPICRDELITSRKIQCGHQFHFRCIFRWVQKREQAECPMCRSGVLKLENRHRCSQTKQPY